jgi:CubicO group peptidase (beta-lactamase class C family)
MKLLRKNILPALLLLITCGTTFAQKMYFPKNTGQWETVTPASLGWNQKNIPALVSYLKEKHTRAFIILVKGRIVMEEYMNGHKQWKPWYWASAGKTLTATAFGIAQQEGLVTTESPVSTYLGKGWTSAPPTWEALITCRHLLTMTSGIDDGMGNAVTPDKLKFKADAGTRWAYHNIYVKLQDVIAKASGKSWEDYFNTALKDKIGMGGLWHDGRGQMEAFSVYWSNARSMARFGLLALNKGNWNGEQIVAKAYFEAMVTSSQDINKSYGYLWWLNGKESYHLPAAQTEFKGSLIPNAPADMYMALGKNDQKIYVIPSKDMVIIRMGESANNKNFALSDFDEELWGKINAVIK